jgi:hypothetical protein
LYDLMMGLGKDWRMKSKMQEFRENMKTRISVSTFWRVMLPCAVLSAATRPATGATNPPPQEVSAALKQIQAQLDEQTKRIDRLYRAIGPHLADLEERAAALEKQAQEDKALALEIIRRVTDDGLSGIGANNSRDTEFGVLTTGGAVRLYDGRGDLVKEVQKAGTEITCLAFSPNGKELLTGTEGGALMIWDLAKGTDSFVCTNIGGKIDRVTWLGNDRVVWGTSRVYWGNDSKPVDHDKPAGGVLDRASGRSLWSFRGLVRNDFQTLTGTENGEQLAVLEIPDQPRGAFLLGATNGDIVHVCYDKQHGSGPLSVGISPGGGLLAVGYAPYDIILWDRMTGKRQKLLGGHSNWVVSLAFSADGKKLISGAGDSTARVWDLEKGEEIGRLRFPGESSYVEGVGLSPKADICFAVIRGLLIVAKVPQSYTR